MRTHWGGGADRDTPDLLPDYQPSVGATVKALRSDWCQETSDSFKMAQAVLGLVTNSSLPIHLRVGNDAVEYAGEAEGARSSHAQRWRQVSVSTEIHPGQPYPICASG
jgi:hypothetical protein